MSESMKELRMVAKTVQWMVESMAMKTESPSAGLTAHLREMQMVVTTDSRKVAWKVEKTAARRD